MVTAEMTLGQKIRRARERKGWTQTTLAQELQVSLMAVSAWETDTRLPRVSVRPKVWTMLGLTPGDFDTDPPPNGGSRRSREARGSEPLRDGGQGMTLGQAISSVITFLADSLSLEKQLDVEKQLWAGVRGLEKDGRHEAAERMQRALTDPDRTGRSILALIIVVGDYWNNRNSVTATAKLAEDVERIAA